LDRQSGEGLTVILSIKIAGVSEFAFSSSRGWFGSGGRISFNNL
jgi:hypothetical protein